MLNDHHVVDVQLRYFNRFPFCSLDLRPTYGKGAREGSLPTQRDEDQEVLGRGGVLGEYSTEVLLHRETINFGVLITSYDLA